VAEPDAGQLNRFTYLERLVHWTVGIAFVLLLLGGLAFSYPKLFWLTALFGGGPSARSLHPWIGLLFSLGMVLMFALWLKDMFLDAGDRAWLRAIRAYAMHDRDAVPPAGKYNAGQKLFYWIQCALAVVFLGTGFALWFPDGLGRGFLTLMRLLHYVATLGGGLFLIVHVYLGIVAYPGTAGAMIHGRVSHGWAKLHHANWYDEETGG